MCTRSGFFNKKNVHVPLIFQVNLDLVQFRTTNVRIEEIRIVPLGVRVEAKFPNGDRLGYVDFGLL